MCIKRVEYKREYIKNGANIVKALHAFSQGVRGFDKSFNIPSISINLGVVCVDDGILKIYCSARAMKNEDLINLANETKSFFELIGCKTSQSNWHKPWLPNIGKFANMVKKEMLKVYGDVSFCTMHAGLESGVLIQRQSKKIEAITIGPTIRFPHSLREECDLDSVDRISLIVERIIDGINTVR